VLVLGLGFVCLLSFKILFSVLAQPVCSWCVVCFCCARFSFFSKTPRDWLGI